MASFFIIAEGFVIFVVHYLKYAKGYFNYTKAINENANDDLDKFETLAYIKLPMILKELNINYFLHNCKSSYCMNQDIG